MAPLHDVDGVLLFVAGEEAPAGRYVRVDVSPVREVILESEDSLPPSFDGRVALYRRQEPHWQTEKSTDDLMWRLWQDYFSR